MTKLELIQEILNMNEDELDSININRYNLLTALKFGNHNYVEDISQSKDFKYMEIQDNAIYIECYDTDNLNILVEKNNTILIKSKGE